MHCPVVLRGASSPRFSDRRLVAEVDSLASFPEKICADGRIDAWNVARFNEFFFLDLGAPVFMVESIYRLRSSGTLKIISRPVLE